MARQEGMAEAEATERQLEEREPAGTQPRREPDGARSALLPMAPALAPGLLQRKLALRLQRKAAGAVVQRKPVAPDAGQVVEADSDDINSSRQGPDWVDIERDDEAKEKEAEEKEAKEHQADDSAAADKKTRDKKPKHKKPRSQKQRDKAAKDKEAEHRGDWQGKFVGKAGVGYRRVYSIGGHDVLVFLPAAGITPPSIDVFVFFHGDVASYASRNKNAWETRTGDDNSAAAMDLAQKVTDSGKNVIAITPQSSSGGKAAWGQMKDGFAFDKIVDGALAKLTADLGLPKDQALKVGHLAIAGHSGGGAALGPAVEAMDPDAVSEVTLQEAGYNFGDSWKKLDSWFLRGQKGKKIRSISISKAQTKGHAPRDQTEEAATRRVLVEDYWQTVHDTKKEAEDAAQGITGDKSKPKQEFKQIQSTTEYGLHVKAIERSIADLKLDASKVKVSRVDVNQEVPLGGGKYTLEYKLVVTGLPGERVIEVYQGGGTHFNARNETIGGLIQQDSP